MHLDLLGWTSHCGFSTCNRSLHSNHNKILPSRNHFIVSNGKSSHLSLIVDDLLSSKGDNDLSSDHPEAVYSVEVNDNPYISQQY